MNKISQPAQFPKFKDYDGQPVRYIQKKYDGHLVKVYKGYMSDDAHRIRVFTKNDKDITEKLLKIDHIFYELRGLPNDTQIFAELHCPGRFSTDVKTMLNEANEDLRLTAFAAPLLGGVSCVDRPLSSVMSNLEEFGLGVPETEILNGATSLSQKWQDELLAYAIEQKLEGYVLKESHMTGWYKLKPTKTVDAFVTGTTMSTSASYYGGLKSIDVAVWDLSVRVSDNQNLHVTSLGTVGGGFKAEFRLEYDTAEKRETLVGRVCEVEYDSLAAGGKLRFPRFKRWRTDKSAEQCTSDQL